MVPGIRVKPGMKRGVAAYAILDLDIHDIEQYLRYQRAVRPVLEAAGARYLARGGEFIVFDGDYTPMRLVLIEFPSLAAMEDFYHSDAYQELEPQRRACSSARFIGVDGCSEVFERGPGA
jgi:uncharacterized protein (DUF1330 family)